MKFLFRFIFVLNLATCLTSCVSVSEPNKINLFDPEFTKQLIKEPIIIPGLTLNLEVTTNGVHVLSENFKIVSLNNKISLPLVGEMDCTGLSFPKLLGKLAEAYKTHYDNPSVTGTFIIEELEFGGGTIGVYGCVGRQGRINMPFTHPLPLTIAILQVGGLTPQANRKIQITRTATPYDFPQLKEPVTQTMEFNYDAILSGKIPDPPLVRDDVVRVLEK